MIYFSSMECQNAVGAFYDYLGSTPSTSGNHRMRLEGTVTEPYGPIATGSRFSYTWIVVNTGYYIYTCTCELESIMSSIQYTVLLV